MEALRLSLDALGLEGYSVRTALRSVCLSGFMVRIVGVLWSVKKYQIVDFS